MRTSFRVDAGNDWSSTNHVAGGMPLGVQLVGKRREDSKLLATALWLEEATRGARS